MRSDLTFAARPGSRGRSPAKETGQDLLYSAFISYNHRDRSWAARLHRYLEGYRVPAPLIGRSSAIGVLQRRLPPVFQDREELAASGDLASSVRQALAQSQSLIVICSTAAAASRWVNEEVLQFVRLGRADRIQCLIVPDADDPSGGPRPEAQLFPPALLDLGIEPLAADARKTGDGARAAFLKLIAGILGVRYDELRQREQARRHKRLLALTAAASLGFLIMSGLTLLAFISRAEAVRQRDIAREQTLAAQRTTDFVKGLFQTSDPSEAKGRSVTAIEILDRGAREIQGQLDNEPNVKAQLVSTLSEVYMGLGSLRKADELIRGSLSLKPVRPETRARQLGVLASSEALQGEYSAAAANYTHGLQLIGDPRMLEDPTLYSGLLVGKAESLAALEKYASAMRLIQTALVWDRRQGGERSADVARDLEAAGLTTQFSGDLQATRANYERALAIRLAVHGRLHPKISEDLNNLGTAAYMQGDSLSAERYWRQALATDERILGPAHPDLGGILNNLARVLVEQRRFAEAIPLLSRSSELYLAQRADTHDDLAFVFSNLALAKNGAGKTSEAEDLFNRALRAAQVHDNRLVAPIMVDLADLRCRHGDYGGALDLLARAAPIMKARYPNDAWRSAWVESTRGDCLLRHRNFAEARQLILSSSPIVLRRWSAESLYGYEARQRDLRLKALAG